MYITRLKLTEKFTNYYKGDMQKIHRFIQSLFECSREVSNTLYRIHETKDGIILYIQSATKPKKPKDEHHYIENIKIVDATNLYNSIENGKIVSLLVQTSPYKKTTVNTSKKARIIYKKKDERIDWMKRKGRQNGFEIMTIEESAGEDIRFEKEGKSVNYPSYRYNAIIRVTDEKAFKKLLCNGLGCGKAYGNGLVTIG